MSDRTREGATGASEARRAPRRASRPRLESLDGRVMPASLAPIAAVTSPTTLGFQVPLDGGTSGPQTFTVTSSNPAVKATVAQGEFLTVGVSHTSSGPTDPAFTGSLTFQLFDDLTPLTTSRIEQLVNQGFYTSPTTGTPSLPDKNFHRVASGFPGASDFIVQGGSQSGDGSGSLSAPGFPFSDEFVQQLAFTGTGQLAMANAGDDTNDSQFFITTGSPRSLDFNFNLFGQLVAGQTTLQEMTQVAVGSDGTTPVNPILFTSTTLSPSSPDGVIHIDTTAAPAGQTSTVTVTAHDAAGATATQSFQVNVSANNDSSGTPIVQRPFLGTIQNQVVGAGQTAVFPLPAVVPTPGDPLTFGVGASVSSTATSAPFVAIPTTEGTATVDANGVVTVTPAAGFTGVIPLVVGVRDQTNRSGGANLDVASNYDTQAMSVTVTNGTVVNLQPIATAASVTVPTSTPTTIQLAGNTANPGSSQTLTFSIVTPPTHGTISNFNASTGTLTYTPNANFLGADSLAFNVTDVGAPTPNLTSTTAIETITVGGANTGAVRLIGNVLVVTPPPKASLADKSRNTISVDEVGGNIQVTFNGLVDATMPAASSLDRIVVYGSKNSDTVSIGSEVLIPTTLDGGHGGVNFLSAGGGPSTLFGWFPRLNVLKGGTANDLLVGRAGVVRFKKSGGNDILYVGSVTPRRHYNRKVTFGSSLFGNTPGYPHGTYYRFIGKKLIPITKS